MQTRRVIQPQPDVVGRNGDGAPAAFHCGKPINCRYGAVGDRLWVRERWAYLKQFTNRRAADRGPIVYGTDPGATELQGAWRPSRHMPRKRSRINLDIVSVRIERLKQISEANARAEGFDPDGGFADPVQWFRDLWDSIMPADGLRWKDNPWVWVISFIKA